MPPATSAPSEFSFIAGHPALDFVNTVDRSGSHVTHERLVSLEALLRWTTCAGFAEAAAERLRHRGRSDPGMASAALARALETRALLHRVCAAVVDGGADPTAPADLDRALHRALSRRHLVAEGRSLRWQWEPVEREFVEVLGPLLISAAELLTDGGKLARLRRCAGTGCGWLFLDRSRHGPRRWCEMRTCGSRDKSRRQHARRREAR